MAYSSSGIAFSIKISWMLQKDVMNRTTKNTVKLGVEEKSTRDGGEKGDLKSKKTLCSVRHACLS